MRWASTYDARLAAVRTSRRRTAEWEVDLLPCQRPGQRQRLGVYERVQRRQQQEQLAPAPPAAPAPQPRWPLQDDAVDAAAVQTAQSAAEEEERKVLRAVWRRLRQADLPREEYALAVRLLHGSLYVGAFLCHIHVLPPHAACCPHPACAAGVPAPPLDATCVYEPCWLLIRSVSQVKSSQG